MIRDLIPKIMGWLVVVITLALAPTIVTYNGHVTSNITAAANSSYMLGMTAIDDFGGFIIIMGLLVTGGLLGVTGAKGSMRGAGVGDMLKTIGVVIITVISLAMFSSSVIGYIDELVTAGTGFEKTAYGILAVIIYVSIIAGASAYMGVKAYKAHKGQKSSSSVTNY